MNTNEIIPNRNKKIPDMKETIPDMKETIPDMKETIPGTNEKRSIVVKYGIEIERVSKSFGNFKALDNISLNVQNGELVALLGPSGSGKTTLLRVIAGLERGDGKHRVLLNGRDVTDIRTQNRHVGFVPQNYALFRNMNVFENIAFGLKVRARKERPDKTEIHRRVNDLLKLIRLDEYGTRYPHQLSGGQKQRVALARALAVDPAVLLLDEPFGALDAKVRHELRVWLKKLHREMNATSVFVTHDQEEAFDIADRIVIMNQGKIVQTGTPSEIREEPRDNFVSDFVSGFVNGLNNANPMACRMLCAG